MHTSDSVAGARFVCTDPLLAPGVVVGVLLLCMHERRELMRKRQAAVVIQSFVRRWQCQRQFGEKIKELRRSRAATAIQVRRETSRLQCTMCCPGALCACHLTTSVRCVCVLPFTMQGSAISRAWSLRSVLDHFTSSAPRYLRHCLLSIPLPPTPKCRGVGASNMYGCGTILYTHFILYTYICTIRACALCDSLPQCAWRGYYVRRYTRTRAMTEAHARLEAATAAVTESKRLRSKVKQTLSPFQHLQCTLYSPTQIAGCHRHL